MSAIRLNPKEWTETVSGWTVRHLLDGRVEVSRQFSVTNASTQSWGSIYEISMGASQSYPYRFASPPSVRAEIVSQNYAILSLEISGNSTSTGSVDTSPNVWITSATSRSGFNVTIALYATGTLA